MEYIVFGIFLGLIVGGMLLKVWRDRQNFKKIAPDARREEELEKRGLEEGPVEELTDTAMINVKWRKWIIPMRAGEKSTWDALPRHGKKAMVDNLLKAVKQGQIEQVQHESGLTVLKPKTKKIADNRPPHQGQMKVV